MNLQNLKKEIPFKWRVGPGGKELAYIDSRDVQNLLDEELGCENWQVRYEEHKGNLFASIGIKVGAEWIWKSDCGTESNIEKQKGEASDAFKRAGVMWGIGRFLYSVPPKAAGKKDYAKLEKDLNDDKRWMNDTDFTKLKSNLEELKKHNATGKDLVRTVRLKYKVNKDFAAMIEELY